MKSVTTIICNKTLFFADGKESFTKGKEYNLTNSSWATTINENTVALDNQDEIHRLGLWYKHFKIKK